MKNKINKYFFQQFIYYFTIVIIALVSIVWIVQAVKFLDLVIEDGHAFTIYFSYSLLTLPKIITRLIPFSFMVALLLAIVKLEKDNELIVMWTSGLNKIKIVNFIFILSIFIMLIQLIMASTISPFSGNLSRTIIKESSLHFFPTLIKEKKFTDVVEDVTFFVEEKTADGFMRNVFLRDENKILKNSSQKSSTIIAEKGFIKQNESTRSLILYNGTIQKEDVSGKINFIKFEKIIINLNNLATKSITAPKIQETSTLFLFVCTKDSSLTYFKFLLPIYKKYSEDVKNNIGGNCDKENKSINTELNRRLGMPIYIPVLGLVGSFVLSSRKESKLSKINKIVFFLIGFLILVFAEIFLRYSTEDIYTYFYYFLPIFLIPVVYFILIKTFKYENLR
jgi:lipopolysaccharide export system permease protein